ncbi:MAG: HAD family phosphatase [Pseudomonadota bacterium]
MPPALLFDMDGTLIDSDPLHAKVFIEFLGELGVSITEEDYISRYQGLRNEDIYRELFTEGDAAAFNDEKEARYRKRLDELPDLMPGTRALLHRARADGARTGCVTNACKENLSAVFERFDLAPLFDFAISADDVSRPKPDPEIYLTAASSLSVAPEDCLVFEDSRSGLTAARTAGATVVGLMSSLDADTLKAHGAHGAIRDFTDPALEPWLTNPQGTAA